MKRKIIISVVVLIIIAILVFLMHFLGDNVYAKFAFSNEDVIRTSENKYRTYKDNPEAFVEYMKDKGWNLIGQGENSYFFEKGGVTVICDVEFKMLYAEYSVHYDDGQDAVV